MTATADDASAVLAGLRNEDGRTWGAAADAVQVADAKAVLTDDPDAPHRHWIGRPRGYSKTQDIGAVMLAALVVGRIPVEHPAYVGAADGKQAGLALDSIGGFVQRSGLAPVVEIQSLRAVHRNGASIEILPADGPGAYGLRPSWVVQDELCQWPTTRGARKFHEALTTALPKVRDSVGIVITTAGTPGHFSHAIYQRALKESKLWRVSMTHTPAPWIDPALVEAERRALTDSAFQRLWCNYFTSAEDALVTAEDLAAVMVLDGHLPPQPGVNYVVTLDVGLVNDRTVLVVAHREDSEDGYRVVVDVLLRWKGSRRKPVDLDEITSTVAEMNRRYPGSIRIDPAKAEHLLQRLRKAGLPISQVNFTTTSVGLLAGSLLRALRTRTLLLPKDDVLREELLNVRIVENSAGVPRLDHASSGHDDHAVALALATYVLTDQTSRTGVTSFGPGLSDEEWADVQSRARIEQARSAGILANPVRIIGGLGIGATRHSMAEYLGDVWLEGDDDDKPNGKVVRSPYV